MLLIPNKKAFILLSYKHL